MKVCIIGFARSRSSFLMEVISNYYKIPILSDDINILSTMHPKLKRSWINDAEIIPAPVGYLNKVKSLLKVIYKQPDGVVRLHPIHFIFHPYNGNLIDFDLFNFEQYDKIYFTSRMSITDSISSQYIADELDQFTIKTKPIDSSNIELRRFNDQTSDILDLLAYNQLLVQHLKTYLQTKNLSWEELYYENITQYTDLNFPGITTTHVETNYNYHSLISNYDDIERMYNSKRKQISQKFYLFNPTIGHW